MDLDDSLDVFPTVEKLILEFEPDEVILLDRIREKRPISTELRSGPAGIGLEISAAFLLGLLIKFFEGFVSEAGKRTYANMEVLVSKLFAPDSDIEQALSQHLVARGIPSDKAAAISARAMEHIAAEIDARSDAPSAREER